MSGERRTRSQLVVPDYIMATASVSPYKQARQAFKQTALLPSKLRIDSHDTDVPSTGEGTSGQADKGKSIKRSVSPETSEDGMSGPEERQIKRAKFQALLADGQDVDGVRKTSERETNGIDVKPKSHGRHASEPNPPRSFAGSSQATRGQSVPLSFPTVPKSPKIDFVSLERESPTRTQSSTKFRIHRLPPQPEESESPETAPQQVVQQATPTPISPFPLVAEAAAASPSRTPPNLTVEIPPSSPMSRSDLLAELSPLSSVPDTSENESSDEEEMTPVPTPKPAGKTKAPSQNAHSRLPRPKSAQSVRADLPSKPKPVAKLVNKTKPQKNDTDVFARMMTASRAAGKTKPPVIMKGKGKSKMQSSSQSNIANTTASTSSQASGSRTQTSVKSKMKARPKATSAASQPLLRPPNSDEEENVQIHESENQENRPPSPTTHESAAPPTQEHGSSPTPEFAASPVLSAPEEAVVLEEGTAMALNHPPQTSIDETPTHIRTSTEPPTIKAPVVDSAEPQQPALDEALVEPSVPIDSNIAEEPHKDDAPAVITTSAVPSSEIVTTGKAESTKPSSTLPGKAPRLTRSTSVKRKADGPAQPAQAKKKIAPFAAPKTPVKATSAPTNADEDSLSELSDYPEDLDDEKASSTQAAMPASSSKVASFARPTAASLARTPAKPVQRSPQKHMIVASPLKLMRSSSDFQANGSPKKLLYGAGTSLDKLTRALQKVRRPLPARPNTTLGFNDGKSFSAHSTSSVGESSAGPSKMSGLGLGFPNTGTLQRSASTDARNMPPPPAPHTSRPNIFSGRTSVMRGGSSGMRGRVGPKASTKSSLPMVPGSPVKGGGVAADTDESMGDALESTHLQDSPDAPSEILHAASSVMDQDGDIAMSETISVGESSKGKERDTSNDWLKGPSRRTSMAARALSMSVNALPKSPSPEPEPEASTPPTRRGGLRSSNNAQPSSSGSAGPSTSAKQKAPKVRGLTVLKDCRVYVDIRDETGNDTGEYFVNMLKLLGAKVMSSVGTTCTHIVYRNGVASTLKKYHMLEDKPFVVGMAWVADCAERQSHVDEKDYLVDLDDVEPIQQKRRRSMLPKFVDFNWDSTPGDADVSMDSVASADDDLPPLERARQRARMLAASSS